MRNHLSTSLAFSLAGLALAMSSANSIRAVAQTPTPAAKAGVIVGRVVLDNDRDGVADERERGIEGWEMIAQPVKGSPCASGDPPKVATDAEGRFRFADLMPCTYTVYQDSHNPGPGPERWALYSPNARSLKSDASGGRAWVQPVTADVAGGVIAEVNFFVIPLEGTASISGLFYYDQNRNGIRDANDALANRGSLIALGYRAPGGYVTVNQTDDMLSDSDPLPWRYEFSDLAAGDYVEGLIGPAGTPANPAVPLHGFAERAVTLSRGQKASGLDFGFEPRSFVVPAVAPSPPVAGTPAINAPSTGEGPGSTGDGTLPWAAAVLTATGLVGLAFALRRRARRL